jgi:hypothetical protein
MDMETITTLTVVGFGNIALIFVIVWIIQTWREEIARNQRRDDE